MLHLQCKLLEAMIKIVHQCTVQIYKCCVCPICHCTIHCPVVHDLAPCSWSKTWRIRFVFSPIIYSCGTYCNIIYICSKRLDRIYTRRCPALCSFSLKLIRSVFPSVDQIIRITISPVWDEQPKSVVIIFCHSSGQLSADLIKVYVQRITLLCSIIKLNHCDTIKSRPTTRSTRHKHIKLSILCMCTDATPCDIYIKTIYRTSHIT